MQDAWGGGAKRGGAEDGRTLQSSVPATRGTPAAYAPAAPRRRPLIADVGREREDEM